MSLNHPQSNTARLGSAWVWSTFRLAPLVISAGVLLAVYAGLFLRRFPLLAFYEQPLRDLGKIDGYDLSALARTGLAFGLLGAAHALAWWSAHGLTARAVGPVIAVSLVSQVILVFVYPIVAADVFNYLLQGRLLALHGLNPLTATPAAGHDVWLPFSPFPNIQLAYGPLWVWLAVAIAALTPDNLLAALLAFKGLAIIANLANSLLIYQIAGRRRPAAAVPALVLYAWSPLVLFETVANAHNDGLMATPLLLALWLVVRGGRLAALAPVAVTAATLIKYAPTVLFPPVLLATWQALARGNGDQRRLARFPASSLHALIAGLALSGLLVVVTFGPFWVGPATLDGVRRQSMELTTSWLAVVTRYEVGGWTREAWLSAARPAVTVVLLIIILWRRPRQPSALPASTFDLLLAQMLVATFWFQPWYLAPLLALAAASADRRRQTIGIVFASSATASYLVYFYLWTTPWWGTLPTPQIQALAAATVYLPSLVVLAASLGHRDER